MQKEKSDLVPVEISDVRNSSVNEAMQSTSTSSSSHSVISDASRVKNSLRYIILSESEEQVSLAKDVTKHEAALSEKMEDRLDYPYNDDGVGVSPAHETVCEVRQDVSETVKISVPDM